MARLKFKKAPAWPLGESGEVCLELPSSKSLWIRRIFLETALWIRSMPLLESEPMDRSDLAEDIRSAMALTTAIRRHMLAARNPGLRGDEQANQIEDANRFDFPNQVEHSAQRPHIRWEAGEAGTVMRFGLALLAFAGLGGILEGQGRAHQRPIQGLVDALRALGARIHYLEKEGYPPLRLEPSTLQGGRVVLPSNVSSQFASALLLGAACRDVHLELYWGPEELLSRPYLDMTLALLQASGWSANAGPHQASLGSYNAVETKAMEPEGDWSAATFWILRQAAHPLASSLTLSSLNPRSLQGDAVLLGWLSWLAPGLEWVIRPSGSGDCMDLNLRVRDGVQARRPSWENPSASPPDEWSQGGDRWICNAAGIPDMVPALAVWAVLCGLRLEIRGVGHLAYKESNRLQALCDNLQIIGIQCRVIHGEEIVLLVEPDRPWAQQLEGHHRPGMGSFRSYGDHRMAMAMSMLAMPGWDIALDDAGVVAKSYPTFWEHWRALGYELED